MIKKYIIRVAILFILYTSLRLVIELFSGASFSSHFIIKYMVEGLLWAVLMTISFSTAFKKINGRVVVRWRNYFIFILPLLIVLAIIFYFSMRSKGMYDPLTAVVGGMLLVAIFIVCLFYAAISRKGSSDT